jgi:hypothetical protein
MHNIQYLIAREERKQVSKQEADSVISNMVTQLTK